MQDRGTKNGRTQSGECKYRRVNPIVGKMMRRTTVRDDTNEANNIEIS